MEPGEIYIADFPEAGAHPVNCVAQCENVLSIEKSQLDLEAGPVGVLDEIALREVVKAVGSVIASDCEPV
jgi:hypothetical protein